MRYHFTAVCKKDHGYFRKGETFDITTDDFAVFNVQGIMMRDTYFEEIFETEFRVDELPIPKKWLSDEVKDDIHRDVWAGHVEDDIRTRCEETGKNISEDDVISAAYNYTHEGDYDCTLSYWDNIDKLIGEFCQE